MGLTDVPRVFFDMVREGRSNLVQWRNNVREIVEKRRAEKSKQPVAKVQLT